MIVEWFYPEEAGQPSRDSFVSIRFFAQHANAGLRKTSRSESSGSYFWFSVVSLREHKIQLKIVSVQIKKIIDTTPKNIHVLRVRCTVSCTVKVNYTRSYSRLSPQI